ncbi:MAG: 4-hydroxy-tetrahydrodipicolinate reductase [Chitinophagaceae bacterium]
MKIALIGYGKMGKAIEQIALERGHEIVLKIDVQNEADFNSSNMSAVDAAIEFTGPESAFLNVTKCFEMEVPVVCGSTGWLSKWEEAKSFCKLMQGSMVYASNYSVGVNIFFEINKKLASLMNAQTEYEISLEETHHMQKKDAPSGTAVSLAEQVLEGISRKITWVNYESKEQQHLQIISRRIDPAAGIHSVKYYSPVDEIEIIHTAHSRTGFATGAVLAAEFIKDKKGIFSMKEVLGF